MFVRVLSLVVVPSTLRVAVQRCGVRGRTELTELSIWIELFGNDLVQLLVVWLMLGTCRGYTARYHNAAFTSSYSYQV